MTSSHSRMYKPRYGALIGLLALILLTGLLPGAARALESRDLPPPPADANGLVREPSRSLEELYLRPGARFGSYRRVLLAPVDVSFNKYWARDHRRDLDAREVLRLRQELAKMARDEFTSVLQRNGGYPVSEVAGPEVLEVRASIVNLDIYAPEINDAAIRHNWVFSAGEATLVAELRDSLTGTLLARVIDRREMRRYNELQFANTVTNSAEVRELVGSWSRLLRRQLDTAHADSKGS